MMDDPQVYYCPALADDSLGGASVNVRAVLYPMRRLGWDDAPGSTLVVLLSVIPLAERADTSMTGYGSLRSQTRSRTCATVNSGERARLYEELV